MLIWHSVSRVDLRRRVMAACCLDLPMCQPLVSPPQPVTNPFRKPRCWFILFTALLQREASRSSVFQMAFQWKGVSSSLLAPSLERCPEVCLHSSGMFTISVGRWALRGIRPFVCSLMSYNLCWFSSSRIAICRLCSSWSPVHVLYCIQLIWQKLRCWHGAKTHSNSRNLTGDSHPAPSVDFSINFNSNSIWLFIDCYYRGNWVGAPTDISGPSAGQRGALAPLFS